MQAHENVGDTLACFYEDDNPNKSIACLSKIALHGDLKSRMNRCAILKDTMREIDLIDIFYQVAKALVSVHGKKIAHRDIKPHNIVLDSCNEVKLIDFGVAKSLKKGDFNETSTGAKGTIKY